MSPVEQDDVLVVAIATGSTYEAAGKAANVSTATVNRRMQDPALRGRVAALRRQVVSAAVGKMVARLIEAVEQLHLIATDGDVESNRLRASIAILELGLKYQAHADLEERVALLEESLRGDGGTSPETGTPERPPPTAEPDSG